MLMLKGAWENATRVRNGLLDDGRPCPLEELVDHLRDMPDRLERVVKGFLYARHNALSARRPMKVEHVGLFAAESAKRRRKWRRTSTSGSSNTIRQPAPWSRMPLKTLSRII
jgi:hypothetical protein